MPSESPIPPSNPLLLHDDKSELSYLCLCYIASDSVCLSVCQLQAPTGSPLTAVLTERHACYSLNATDKETVIARTRSEMVTALYAWLLMLSEGSSGIYF